MSRNGFYSNFRKNSEKFTCIYGDIIKSQMTIDQNDLMNIETQLWAFFY